MILALAGNQNCGKTTLFNALTGSNQHVGNFPGVTVEGKRGEVRGTKNVSVVDLPGIYSIRPYTSEEIVSRDFLLDGKVDGIINIVDATNIERNLYLTLQLLELKKPMVVALNMMDELRAGGGSVDISCLSQILGVAVVPIVASKGEGITDLVRLATAAQRPKVMDFCADGPVHRCIHAVSHVIEDHARQVGMPARFCATKLIEGEEIFGQRLGLDQNELDLVEHSVTEMETETDLDRNAALADMRYTFIEKAVARCVKRPEESPAHKRSAKIDKILTGRYTAFPVFLLAMAFIFAMTFSFLGVWLSDGLAWAIDAVSAAADRGLTAYGINPVVHSLIIDGIFAGVGGVLSFLPVIVTLFFFLSILEDTGYMARVAFVMDKPLRRLGLSGRSFVPMLIGFGCTVPAVMATRTLASQRDKRMTILLTPFMSCPAKIPIYSVFCAAFFPRYATLVIICLYLAGIGMGVATAWLLKGTVYRGNPAPFVMELPDYRLPSAKNVAMLLWDKARDFLKKAFTIIFVASVAVWFLRTFDSRINVAEDPSLSLLAALGRIIAPAFRPLGFGDWRAATALMTGFTAKEAVVSTLTVLLGANSAQISEALSGMFSGLSAASFLVFTLLYTPCAAAVASMRRELGSGWGALAAVVMQCAIAWLAAFVVYTVGGILL